VNYMGGVDWRENRFDHGGDQFTLSRSVAALPELQEILEGDMRVLSLAQGRRVNFAQDWILLHARDFSTELWATLIARYSTCPEDRAR